MLETTRQINQWLAILTKQLTWNSRHGTRPAYSPKHLTQPLFLGYNLLSRAHVTIGLANQLPGHEFATPTAKENRNLSEEVSGMRCALIYDFDGTLAKGNCAEHGLFGALNIKDATAFWDEAKAKAKAVDGDQILAYLGLLVAYAQKQGSDDLSVNKLTIHGKEIPLFPGVDTWFERINRYAADNGIALAHFIISSGLDAMIKGTPVARYFHNVFACKYDYNENGYATWPAQAINYTTKTQYLFRINKGIENSWNDDAVNRFIEPSDRPIPFTRMIYLGDGDTDIPSMKMVRYQGGYSLAVFDQEKWNKKENQPKIEKLIAEERANYVVPADYEDGSQLDITIKGLLQLFKRKGVCA